MCKVLAFYAPDLVSIVRITDYPQSPIKWPLSTKLGGSPEHSGVAPKNTETNSRQFYLKKDKNEGKETTGATMRKKLFTYFAS